MAYDCPYGLHNDPYPGECALYKDVDSNKICDLSQDTILEATTELTGKEIKGKTVEEVAGFYKINTETLVSKLSDYLKVKIKSDDSFQLLHDNYGLEPSFVNDLAKEIKNTNNTTTSSIENIIEKQKDSDKKSPEKNYFILEISFSLIALYVITFILAKRKIISDLLHKKIWNNILLIAFLGMGILGILLTIRIQYNLKIILPFNMLFWHVELGIAMAIISMFHILWHIKYYINIKKK